MEQIHETISVKNNSLINNEYKIPVWQINQVRERTEKFLKNPGDTTDIDDFLKEIDAEINQF